MSVAPGGSRRAGSKNASVDFTGESSGTRVRRKVQSPASSAAASESGEKQGLSLRAAAAVAGATRPVRKTSSVAGATNVKVFVRLRPLNEKEEAMLGPGQGIEDTWAFDEHSISQKHLQEAAQSKTYKFDHVFDPDSETYDVYGDVASELVDSCVQGFHATVFAYGQTSSGKTHSMLGEGMDDPGIIPLSIDQIFVGIKESKREFLLRVQYLEIYNEIINDLLNPASGTNLRLAEDPEFGVKIVDVRDEIISSPSQMMAVLDAGEANRSYGATQMNDRSSRSHTVFRMLVESREPGQSVWQSVLTLVDLAGSENADKAGTARGGASTRLKEGAHINKSLLTLGNVIRTLSEGKASGFVPFRDSKLTRLLQPSLGGNSFTSVLTCISPAASHMAETLSTLAFALTCKKIKNTPKKNETEKTQSGMLEQMQSQLEALEQQLEEANAKEVELQQHMEKVQSLESEKGKAEEEKVAFEKELEVQQEKHAEMDAKMARLQNLLLNAGGVQESEKVAQQKTDVKKKARQRRASVAFPGQMPTAAPAVAAADVSASPTTPGGGSMQIPDEWRNMQLEKLKKDAVKQKQVLEWAQNDNKVLNDSLEEMKQQLTDETAKRQRVQEQLGLQQEALLQSHASRDEYVGRAITKLEAVENERDDLSAKLRSMQALLTRVVSHTRVELDMLKTL